MQTEYNSIIIRQGEIFLKGNNKSYFESLLAKNIKEKLCSFTYKFHSSRNRFYIDDFDVSNRDDICKNLLQIFGIYSISNAIKIPSDLETIIKTSSDLVTSTGSFRVTVKRADKKIPYTSVEIAALVGKELLNRFPDLKVKLTGFDFEINIDIRENGQTYIYKEIQKGLGGLPTGCSGKGLLLLSGGIDSPVAGYLITKRGMKIFGLHFYSFPYTGEQAIQKVRDLSKVLSIYNLGFKLFLVKLTDIQLAIHQNCPKEYMITIMRRFMMRIAEKIALQNNVQAIITGESLGQVASQTIEGITITNDVLESIPVLRPLIGFDKDDTIQIAKKIETFDISTLPYEDCCTVFLPEKPVIHPKRIDIERIELNLNIEAFVEDALSNINTEIY